MGEAVLGGVYHDAHMGDTAAHGYEEDQIAIAKLFAAYRPACFPLLATIAG